MHFARRPRNTRFSAARKWLPARLRRAAASPNNDPDHLEHPSEDAAALVQQEAAEAAEAAQAAEVAEQAAEDATQAAARATADLHARLDAFSFTEEELQRRRAIRERLAIQSGVVLKLGTMLMGAGAGSYRVKTSMARLATAIGIEKHQSQVSLTELTTTAYAAHTFRTELAEQRAVGVNADRIDELRRFVRDLRPGLLAEDAEAELDRIANKPHLYSRLQLALASGFGCAGFAFLNKGGWVECSVVLFAAFIGQYIRSRMLGKRFNHVATWMVCATVASSLYISAVMALMSAGLVDSTHQAGAVSAMLFLVPGFPLVTAILDLVRLDLIAGLTRGAYVLILMVSAGVAMWVVSSLFHWSVTPSAPPEIAPSLLIALNALATFIAAFCFALLFNSPWKVALTAATIGAVLNPVRIFAVTLGAPNQAMVGIACLLVGLVATAISAKTYFSRVTLSVPAVVIMIPGVPFYRAITALNMGQTVDAIASILEISFVILAIGVGLAISRMVTDRGWAFDSPTLPTTDLSPEMTTVVR